MSCILENQTDWTSSSNRPPRVLVVKMHIEQEMTSSCVQPSAGLWTLAADVLTWSLDMPHVSAGAAPEIRLIKEERVDGFDEVMWSELACFHICLAAVETLLEFDCRSFIVNTFRDPRGSKWHWSCSAGTKQQNVVSDASYVWAWSEAKMLKVNWKHLSQRAEISRIWTEKSQSLW